MHDAEVSQCPSDPLRQDLRLNYRAELLYALTTFQTEDLIFLRNRPDCIQGDLREYFLQFLA